MKKRQLVSMLLDTAINHNTWRKHCSID